MINLNTKSILLIAPKFFDYEREIYNKLVEFGANVFYYNERPDNNFFTKAIIRVNKKLIKKKIEKYYYKILKDIYLIKLDYVIVVNAEAISLKFLKELREYQNSAKFVLYMWDSLLNKNRTGDLIEYFDSTFSFDHQDCERIEKLKFLPLFYIDSYKEIAINPVKSTVYDFCFIGTIHSDRFNILQSIIESQKEIKINYFFYMFFHNRILFLKKKIMDIKFKKARFSDFHFNSLTLSQTFEYINLSKIIIDINHPNQSGLTMRTIETLGAKKKLITTNSHVKRYDFYNDNNILVIDRANPIVPYKFLISPYQEISNEIYKKYSIENWIKSLLE